MRSRTGEALTGRIAVGMERLSGNVTSVQGDRVTLFVPGRVQTKIGIGSNPSLHLRVGNQPEASFTCQLVRRSDEAHGVELILKLLRPWEVQDKLTRLLSNFFGRRQHLRIKPDARHGLTLQIRTETPWTATVMDLSEGGMAFCVQASVEPADLLVELLPLQLRTRVAGPWDVQAAVRGRWLQGQDGIAYGVQFLAPPMAMVVAVRMMVQNQLGG